MTEEPEIDSGTRRNSSQLIGEKQMERVMRQRQRGSKAMKLDN